LAFGSEVTTFVSMAVYWRMGEEKGHQVINIGKGVKNRFRKIFINEIYLYIQRMKFTMLII